MEHNGNENLIMRKAEFFIIVFSSFVSEVIILLRQSAPPHCVLYLRSPSSERAVSLGNFHNYASICDRLILCNSGDLSAERGSLRSPFAE